ncbi:MAG: PKD domain-containing protein, partial [Thermoplasmatota archaeon]
DDGDGTWSLDITLDDSISSMTYTLTVTDSTSNSVTGSTQTVTVTDNDDPSLTADNSPATGTTGDTYAFDISATDNIGVNSVTVTWSHGSLSGSNVALNDDGDGTWSLDITLDDSISSMTYTITVTDTSSNSVTGSTQTVTVTDNDDPTFTDNSPGSGTTGDTYSFDVAASDNVAVSGVSVTWSHGSLSGTNTALSDDGDGTWSLDITLDDSISSMTYTLTVTDSSSNSVTGSTQTVTVTDNDAPTFSNPTLNPDPPTTGESVQVSVDISDNIGVDNTAVRFHYDFGSGYSSTTSFSESTGTYTFTVSAPSDSTSLSYYVTADDTSGNTGTSTTWTSSVADNDDPSLDADNSPGTGTTGDTYTFDITASDNVDVGAVSASWSHGSLGGTASLSDDGDGTWSGTITLDDSTSSMTYTVTVIDTSSNSVTGSTQTVTVTDNDAPTFTRDNTPSPATTGDSFNFSVEVDDNIDGSEVHSVYVYYCYGNNWSGTTGNVTMSYVSAETVWNGTITVMDTLQSINYNISARDDAGNWNTWTGYVRPVIDNDPPSIVGDTTPSAGTTGDPFNFTMTAQDNIEVYRVYVSYAYLGGNSYDNLMMNEGPSGWYLVVNLEDTLSPMSYNFTVVDTSMNTFVGGNKGVTISDNDDPILFSDMSDRAAEAGKDFVFKIMATDNIGVASVNVEYWYSYNTQHKTTGMEILSGNVYYLEITLPAEPGTLYYIFNAQDVFSPPNDGSTEERSVEILDITPPVIVDISFADTAYTGDEYLVTATVTDDVEVNYVKMWYFFGDEMSQTPMFVDGSPSGDVYTFTIDISDSLDALNFWIVSADMEANLQETDHYMIEVVDDDLPMVTQHLSDPLAFTGDPYTFELNATDNIGINWVNVTYMLPGGEWQTVRMEGMDGNYHYSMTLPNDLKGDMSYFFDVYDTSMNVYSTEVTDVAVMDDELPVALINGPADEFQHVMVQFSASGSSDNVGITDYTWEIDGEVLDGMEVNYTFDEVGIYTIELKVSDGENPTVSTSYNITIRDADDPVISLEVPTEIGNHMSLYLNASGSTDNVGISSFSWLLVLPDNTQVTDNGPIFEYSLEGILGHVTLYLTVSDDEGNTVREVYGIDVVDLLPPTVIVPDDLEEMEGEYLTFDGTNSYDNTGVTRWVWHLTSPDIDVEHTGKTFSYFFEVPNRYNITLTVFDSANNSAKDYFIVNILAKGDDFDTDGDGMPDSWEKKYGLDPELDDADRDYDGDLLTNIQEYRLGLNPKSSDTDGDGMPDKYEYDYAYHEGRTDLVDGVPRWMAEFKPNEDNDEDGDTNLEEYRQGYRDPTVKDAVEEKEDKSTTYIIVSVVVLVIILLVIVALIIFAGRVRPVREDLPESQYPHLYKNVQKEEGPEEKQ